MALSSMCFELICRVYSGHKGLIMSSMSGIGYRVRFVRPSSRLEY